MEMDFHLLRRAGYDERVVSEVARTMGYEETPRRLRRRRGDRRARDPRARHRFLRGAWATDTRYA